MQIYELKFDEKFVKPVLDNTVSKVVQFSFPKGKVLEKHKTSSHILVTVISGKVRFSSDGHEDAILEPGRMVSLEPNIEHSVEALEESIMILTLTPSPSAHTIFKPN